MFKLDMEAIRRSAEAAWLTANLAKPANARAIAANENFSEPLEADRDGPPLATLAGLAISQEISQASADLLAARLIAAAMRVCDAYGDGEKARQEMRADMEATPPDQRASQLEHMEQRAAELEQQTPWLSFTKVRT